MKVAILSARDEGTVVVGTLQVGPSGSVVMNVNPAMQIMFRNLETFEPNGTAHSFDEGRPWLENLPRTFSGTRQWAEFVEDPVAA